MAASRRRSHNGLQVPVNPVVKTDFAGRKFVENENYPSIYRRIVHRSSPNWLYTVEIVKDINRDGIDTGKIFVRIARWKAINDRLDKKIKYWKQFRGYNIRSPEEWESASGVVNALYGTADVVRLPQETLDQVYQKLADAEETNKKLKNDIKKLKDLNSTYEAENEIYKAKYRVIKRNIREYKKTLADFKTMYEAAGATETEVHKFIDEHKAFWMFGLDYTDMLSKEPIPLEVGHYKDVEFDLLLKRQDMFWDLVELKGPDANLFDKRTKHRLKLNSELSEALSQIIMYLDVCDIYLNKVLNVFKPKAIIVIGRKDKDVIRYRKLFASYLNNIELITYSDLYERGKSLLEYINSIES